MPRSTSENPAERETQVDEERAESRIQAASADATHVKYVGQAHVREIFARDWKELGVENQDLVRWDVRKPRGNVIPLTDLQPGAVDYLVNIDGNFRLCDQFGKLA